LGKLADAIKEYKISPINSPQERAAKDIITKITESEWWSTQVGTKFNWPVKINTKKHAGIFDEPYFVYFGNMLIPRHEFCPRCLLHMKGLLTEDKRRLLYAYYYNSSNPGKI
jgi:hypothetical protein